MSKRDAKVVGYFAYASPQAVVCSGSACVISGTEEAMRRYVIEMHPRGAGGYTVRKTRFVEIMRGMRLGAAYAFDEESYSRFLPLGRAEGLALADADFSKHDKRFFTVQLRMQ